MGFAKLTHRTKEGMIVVDLMIILSRRMILWLLYLLGFGWHDAQYRLVYHCMIVEPLSCLLLLISPCRLIFLWSSVWAHGIMPRQLNLLVRSSSYLTSASFTFRHPSHDGSYSWIIYVRLWDALFWCLSIFTLLGPFYDSKVRPLSYPIAVVKLVWSP